jgi:hypothetical protein
MNDQIERWQHDACLFQGRQNAEGLVVGCGWRLGNPEGAVLSKHRQVGKGPPDINSDNSAQTKPPMTPAP